MERIQTARTVCMVCRKVFEIINYATRPKPVMEIDLCCSDECREIYVDNERVKHFRETVV